MKTIIFLHGFFASGSCVPAMALKEAFEGKYDVLAPDLPLHPHDALAFVAELCEVHKPDLIVGNSCGAFYAQMASALMDVPALLSNPYFIMTDFLKERKGSHQYKSPRADGKQEFVIDDHLIDEFERLQSMQFNKISKAKVWGIFGDNDPIAHFEPMFLEHYKESHHFHGAHTPTAEEIKSYHVPLIEKMMKDKDPMKIVLAFDSFKGCMTAEEACRTAAQAIHEVLPDAEVVECPLSDGGEGLVNCVKGMLDVNMVTIDAHDPLMNPMKASYAVSVDCATAYMEMAETSGLPLVPKDKRNPLLTTTYGVGDMIADATRRGCKKIIMGIEKHTSGEILFDGEEISEKTISERAKLGIGYAFQQPPRFKGIKVRQLLNLSAGDDKAKQKTCPDSLVDVGLCAKDYINRDVDASLSGGELKRIEIATLLNRPLKLALFDEPEAGIDLWSFAKLTETFSKMHDTTTGTIAIISHQERILELADEIILVVNGEIKKMGPRDQVLPGLLVGDAPAPKKEGTCCGFKKGGADCGC